MTAAVAYTIPHAIIDATVAWGTAWLSVTALAAAAVGWGRLALAPFDRAMDGPRFDHRLVTLAVGAGVLALLVLVIGLAGVLYRPVLIGLLLTGAAGWIIRRSAPIPHPSEPPPLDHALTRLAVTGGRALAVALIAFGVLMPEFFHDALIYHLELPRYALLHHRIDFLPWNYNSALPANLESLYLIVLAFSDERATKLIHAALALLCVAALGALGRHLAPQAQASRQTGRLAGTLFLLTPSVVLLAGVSGNDLGLLFFELTSLLAWWRWRMASRALQEGLSSSPGRAWLISSGLLMGLAIGTKYSALFFLAGMTAAWAALLGSNRDERRLVLRAYVWWLLIAAATGSPWLVKNLLATGDPLYPTFAAHLNQPFLDEAGVAWLRHDLGAGGIDFALWPDYLFKLATNDIGWLTLVAAMLTAVVVLSRPRYRFMRPLLALIAAFATLWWFASPVPRYLMPAAALLSLLGAIGLAGLVEWSMANRTAGSIAGRALRVTVGIAIIAGLLGQSIGAATLIRDNYIAPFTALTGLRALEPGRVGASTAAMASSILELIPDGPARQQWLAWSVPPYAAIDAANRLLPDEATVLFVGEYRGYYLQRDRIISTKYDVSPLVFWAGVSANAQELEGWLRREGVTHLLYNQVEARRLEQAGYPALRWPNQASRERFEQLRRERLTLLTVQNGVFLYAVGRSPATDGS